MHTSAVNCLLCVLDVLAHRNKKLQIIHQICPLRRPNTKPTARDWFAEKTPLRASLSLTGPFLPLPAHPQRLGALDLGRELDQPLLVLAIENVDQAAHLVGDVGVRWRTAPLGCRAPRRDPLRP